MHYQYLCLSIPLVLLSILNLATVQSQGILGNILGSAGNFINNIIPNQNSVRSNRNPNGNANIRPLRPMRLGVKETSTDLDKGLLESDMKQHIRTCNDQARLWIRAAFHDAGTWEDGTGGADGSLIFELDRSENAGLEQAIDVYQRIQRNHDVSMADLIAFGGVLAFEECVGPRIDFEFNRMSVSVPNARNKLPSTKISSRGIIDIFVNRLKFEMDETVALIGGAHSTANVHRKVTTDARPGPMDNSPNTCDSSFFKQLKNQPGRVSLRSDRMMRNDDRFKDIIDRFANDEKDMIDTYAAAFTKMINLVPDM